MAGSEWRGNLILCNYLGGNVMAFEDLEVWKKSARMSADLYREFSSLKDYGFKDQITRAGLSIPSNISEGY